LRTRASAVPQVPVAGFLALFSSEDRSDDTFQGWVDADPADATIQFNPGEGFGYGLTSDYTKALSVRSYVGTQQNMAALNEQNGNPYVGPALEDAFALGTGGTSYFGTTGGNFLGFFGILESPAGAYPTDTGGGTLTDIEGDSSYSESAVWSITADGNADMVWVNPEGSVPATFEAIAFYEGFYLAGLSCSAVVSGEQQLGISFPAARIELWK
ncbi:hypothetical protein MNV49_001938, partial [Pseudohyphozyma bogoriensis]